MRRAFSISLVLLVLAAISITPTPVSAAGEFVQILEIDTSACAEFSPAFGTVTHINGSATQIRFTLSNLTRGTTFSFTYPLLPPGTYPFILPIPAGTQTNDSMESKAEMLDSGSAVLSSDVLAYPCGGNAVDGRINYQHGDIYVVIYKGMD